MFRIYDLRLPAGFSDEDLLGKIADAAGVSIKEITEFRIYRKSVDARKKNDVHFVISCDFTLMPGVQIKNPRKKIEEVQEKSYSWKKDAGGKKYIVVGSGPAGMFAALVLARAGACPLVLERGKSVEERQTDVQTFWHTGVLNPESNVQFGEGGAGTFSDGKLNSQINDERCRLVLNEFVQAGGPSDILYQAKPHLGTDNLIPILQNIRNEIINLGGRFLFQTKMTGIQTEKSRITSVHAETWGENGITQNEYPCDALILAIGHSARDTFTYLHENGFSMEQKIFSAGFRIEHSLEFVDKAQYGGFSGKEGLRAADYKLSCHLPEGRSVYTFCMCPGGFVTASASEENLLCTNGMSNYRRDGMNSNSAVLTNVFPKDYDPDNSGNPLAGVQFQREMEKKAFYLGGGGYHAPVQQGEEFAQMVKKDILKYKSMPKIEPTYRPGVKYTELDKIYPAEITATLKEGLVVLNRKMPGFVHGLLTGVETRSSSPVRILRHNESLQSNVTGVYPCGEGAGYAGGIMSAAVDGIKCAEKAIEWEHADGN